MSIELRLPKITGNDREQLTQIRSYLYQLTEQLQWALNTVDTSQGGVQQTTKVAESFSQSSNIETPRNLGYVDDFITASGTYDTDIGIWYYKKWASGTYQMFGCFDVTLTSSDLNDSLYYTNSISIPIPFKISSACVSGSVMGYCGVSNGGISIDHDAVELRLISDEQLNVTSTVNVGLIVMGNYE